MMYVLEDLYKQVAEGSIDPFWLWRMAKKIQDFFSELFVIYLGYVITKIIKRQKISTCYVNYKIDIG